MCRGKNILWKKQICSSPVRFVFLRENNHTRRAQTNLVHKSRANTNLDTNKRYVAEHTMPRKGKKRIVINCLVINCLVISCVVINCLVINCLVINCLVINCVVINCLVINCLVINCLVTNCFVISCLVINCFL